MRDGSFVVASPTDKESIRRIKPGDGVMVDLRKPRNLGHHRKYWALVGFLVSNGTMGWDSELTHEVIKYGSGLATTHTLTNGTVICVGGSISFASMDQIEFEKFYERALDFAVQDILPAQQYSADDLRRCVEEVLAYGEST